MKVRGVLNHFVINKVEWSFNIYTTNQGNSINLSIPPLVISQSQSKPP
jgi:hypothetical protein